MKFVIISHAEHKLHENEICAYEPFVKEMNLWLKYVDKVMIVAPFSEEPVSKIDCSYIFKNKRNRSITDDKIIEGKVKIPNQVGNDEHKKQQLIQVQHEEIATSHTPRNDGSESHPQLAWGSHDSEQNKQMPNQVGHDGCIKLTKIPSFDITSIKNGIKAIYSIPKICFQIYKAMQWADHIHLRCPGNIGLLGCFVQVVFPNKPKTVKYAGNWDPMSIQPRSYRLQKWIVSNTFLTRNCKVLVYGDWPNQSKNIVPFFTASYSEKEIEEVVVRSFVGFKQKITHQVRDDEKERHSQLDWESHDGLLKQVQHDEKEQIATSHTPRNDDSERHPEFSSGSDDVEHNDELLKQVQHELESHDGMMKQVQHDEKERHSQLDWESHDGLLKQVQHDEKEQIATSHTPRNDDSERHPEFSSGSPASNLKFIYVGGLVPGKQPLLSVQVVHELKRKGYNVQLDMYGEGVERMNISDYILDNSLEEVVFLHGNAPKEIVKKAYQQAHFLVFISKSEGWPKVVAEAMFWGCVPLTSAVSCVPEMLGNGSRGTLVSTNVAAIVRVVEGYIENKETYNNHAHHAMEWSRVFTLEKFEEAIGKLFDTKGTNLASSAR